MADTDEDCDTWRNRDKYQKEREPSEKKNSPSPVDQKTEKRPFNNSQSPAKSPEPPFKRQKNNFGDDSGFNNSGNYNRRDNFDNKRDNFNDRKDNFGGRRDSFDNRRGGFNNRRGNFDNRRDSFDNRRDGFDNRRDGFDNRRDGFDNRRDNFDNRRDGFDNRRDGNDNRREGFDNRRNNFDNRKENNDNQRDGFENRKEASDNRFPMSMNSRSAEETPNYPTQPQLLLFKQFLLQQDDDIEMQVAMAKYSEYKDSFVKKQLKAFFDAHCSQEWFREKYFPSFQELNQQKEANGITKRKEIFTYLLERKWMDNINLHIDESDSIIRLMDAVVILLEGGNENDLKILDSRRYRSESPNDVRIIEVMKTDVIEETKVDETEIVKENEIVETVADPVADETETVVEESQEGAKTEEPRALHKTYSIFLRNLHPNVLRSEIEALVKPYEGFLRLALQDPTPERKFFRRGWVTYDRTVNIKEICWNFNNVRLHDCDIGAIVNRELSQRVRPVHFLTNHKPVMRQDVKMAAKLVAKFDRRHNLGQNPLLQNITEYLVEEGSSEEEALLGVTMEPVDQSSVTIETDEKLAAVLDRLILYLRFVHSYDFYSHSGYQMEDDMPHRCGMVHVRGVSHGPLSSKDVEEYMQTAAAKAETVVNGGANERLSVEEAVLLGLRNVSEVTEEFIAVNTVEVGPEKWLCPLSGKKFRGPAFVRKHLLTKHTDKIEESADNAAFFNNYLLDGRRPQLPEHPTSNAAASSSMVVAGRGEARVMPRTGGGSPVAGSYYRKTSISAGPPRIKTNGDGSYYSRKLTTYDDLDAPADD